MTVTAIDTTTDLGARAAARLPVEQVLWLVTVDPHDAPQPTPVWFRWDGADEVVVKSQPRTAKLRNVRGNPRVAVHLNSTATGGDVVVLTGTAAIDDAGLTPAERAAYDAKYDEGIRGLGTTPDGFHDDYSVTVRIRLERLRGY
ncbi:TIGR03667 family PPOX class F420-dependent oxidoreductase [Cellulosimicrobium protaetiae]|uniref:TIGR03667 family PPOX class F420-dependent oxidoreductase n=1 Tax=Cellulosimicrobium protaetiae TaxID=2587808 RepID=A0A6M5UIM3_9MICO|nr:TIGR03667 family PPOX class F420-dependent oxidoreductase [Cellulosimicrobium protaetiae]QJW37145.1 TIGR03667 family PPOX class F420-dependent oxidoreductase [Cellulosimicrobium protaetiae]